VLQVRSTAWKCPFFVLAASFRAAAASFAEMKPDDRRKAYGPRAPIMEAVHAALYPGAQVQWDPAFTIQLPGQQPRMVDVPVYMRGNPVTGDPGGIASIEFDGTKEQYILQAQSFRRTDSLVLPTVLIVFRADAVLHIAKYKKLLLDPGQPCNELKTMLIHDWPPQKEWPTLDIPCDTHIAHRDSFTTIEWHNLLDANTGQFISRLPFGISRKVRGGSEQMYPFSLRRVNASTIDIGDFMSGESHRYNLLQPLRRRCPDAPVAVAPINNDRHARRCA
jgi:hypothetical protein